MITIRNFCIETLTLVFIFAGSLTTTLALAETGSTENRVTIDVKNVESRSQAHGPQRFDGSWWAAADSEEQQGFIVGFLDCYYDTVKRRVTSEAFTEEYQKAVSEFYVAHPNQNSTTVPETMVRLVQTLKSSRKALPGGEVWNESHGYFDGGYWNQSTDKERLGFLEGYIQCYKNYMRRPRVRFSRSVEEYSGLLTKYFGDPKVNHEKEKIAHVLHRLAAR